MLKLSFDSLSMKTNELREAMVNSNKLDLNIARISDDHVETLKELSLEEEAMMVLKMIAKEKDLEEDTDLIRYIYREAIKSHDSEKNMNDISTIGREIFQMIEKNIDQTRED